MKTLDCSSSSSSTPVFVFSDPLPNMTDLPEASTSVTTPRNDDIAKGFSIRRRNKCSEKLTIKSNALRTLANSSNTNVHCTVTARRSWHGTADSSLADMDRFNGDTGFYESAPCGIDSLSMLDNCNHEMEAATDSMKKKTKEWAKNSLSARRSSKHRKPLGHDRTILATPKYQVTLESPPTSLQRPKCTAALGRRYRNEESTDRDFFTFKSPEAVVKLLSTSAQERLVDLLNADCTTDISMLSSDDTSRLSNDKSKMSQEDKAGDTSGSCDMEVERSSTRRREHSGMDGVEILPKFDSIKNVLTTPFSLQTTATPLSQQTPFSLQTSFNLQTPMSLQTPARLDASFPMKSRLSIYQKNYSPSTPFSTLSIESDRPSARPSQAVDSLECVRTYARRNEDKSTAAPHLSSAVEDIRRTASLDSPATPVHVDTNTRTKLFSPCFSENYLSSPATPCTPDPNTHAEDELIGDMSRPYGLPYTPCRQQDLRAISPDTMARLLNNEFSDVIGKVTIVDCRYPYEYAGGHIVGATNHYTKDSILTDFLSMIDDDTEDASAALPMTPPKRNILIFHCEFSQERGPKLMRYLRNLDRDLHMSVYPKLSYPEIYILEGGYKEFAKSHLNFCDPQDYCPMIHKDYINECQFYRTESKVFESEKAGNVTISKGKKKLSSKSSNERKGGATSGSRDGAAEREVVRRPVKSSRALSLM